MLELWKVITKKWNSNGFMTISFLIHYICYIRTLHTLHTLHTYTTYIHYIHTYIHYVHTLHTYATYIHTYITYIHNIHTLRTYTTYIHYVHTLRTYTTYIHYINNRSALSTTDKKQHSDTLGINVLLTPLAHTTLTCNFMIWSTSYSNYARFVYSADNARLSICWVGLFVKSPCRSGDWPLNWGHDMVGRRTLITKPCVKAPFLKIVNRKKPTTNCYSISRECCSIADTSNINATYASPVNDHGPIHDKSPVFLWSNFELRSLLLVPCGLLVRSCWAELKYG